MASIGLVGQHFLKFPGFENSPAGFSLMGKGEGVLGFFAIFLVSGFLELAWREDPAGEREPGNYGDPFGVQMYNDEMRMKELNNGRMAMISVLGIFAAEIATGKDAIEQFGLWIVWSFKCLFHFYRISLAPCAMGTVWAHFCPCKIVGGHPFLNLRLNSAPNPQTLHHIARNSNNLHVLGAVEFHKLVQEVYGKDQSDDMQFVSVLSSWLTCMKSR